MTFLDCWFGYAEGGVAATEWYPGPPCWWDLPTVTGEVRIHKLGVGLRGFVVPWAMFVDEDWHFWLNGNYTVHVEPGEKACMEVSHTEGGYFVGCRGVRREPGRQMVVTRTPSFPSPW